MKDKVRKMIYLDNSATTKPSKKCIEAIDDMLCDNWANPSSLHSNGVEAMKVIIKARENIAHKLHCDKNEIYFTSGGTEANNTAILGTAHTLSKRGKRIVTTEIEHESVIESMKELERQGFEIIRLKPDKYGHISEDDLISSINEETILVSMMYVNNEVGSILPVTKIRSAIVRSHSPALIHIDSVQAFGKIDFSPSKLGADFVTISAHKVHGPKGVGALYIRNGVHIPSLHFGGEQEKRMRPGTEAAPLIAGFGAAVSEISDISTNLEKIDKLNKYAKNKLLSIDGIKINSGDDAIPYILNIYVPTFMRSQTIVQELSANYEICVSSGSACARGKRSHVLAAMHLNDKILDKSIRISFSNDNTTDDVDRLYEAILDITEKYKIKD